MRDRRAFVLQCLGMRENWRSLRALGHGIGAALFESAMWEGGVAAAAAWRTSSLSDWRRRLRKVRDRELGAARLSLGLPLQVCLTIFQVSAMLEPHERREGEVRLMRGQLARRVAA